MKISYRHSTGAAILEVLLAVVIFVIGMLALAHLQTNVTRSATDATTRTGASNLGEEILEQLRAFQLVSTDPNGTIFAYADITDGYVGKTVTRGGITFTVTGDVKGYNFNADKTAVTEVDPAVAGTVYDFKLVDLTIAWDNNQQFQVSDTQQISKTAMNTGSITISEIIPSIPSLGSAKVAAEDDGALGGPPVDYTPGQLPDAVPINLDNSKFKESTTPLPDVKIFEAAVETWFDVVTYNNVSNKSIFLRREEFLIVSCSCTLKMPSGGAKTGFLPTTWNGVEYVEGEFVSKPYGVSNANKQSQFCDGCCRDHHDSSSYPGDDTVFDPAKDWTQAAGNGDHKHFGPDNSGTLVEATGDGDDYVEACRMIRKDGFMRVAQDFRQEGLVGVTQDYFNSTSNANAYSGYVTDAVKDFYEQSKTTMVTPADVSMTLPADSAANPLSLPTADPADFAQMVSRGIYIDHLTAAAADMIDCMAPTSVGGQGKTGDDCGANGAQNYLEIFPFSEVQTTWLSWWEENVNGNPVSVTVDALADDNAHSRGLVELTGTSVAAPIVNTFIHRGNIGLASTDPIDPYYASGLTTYNLFVEANAGGGTPPPSSGKGYSGQINSSLGSVKAANTTITGSGGASCTKTALAFNCTVSTTATAPKVTVTGYNKNNSTLYVCLTSGLSFPISHTHDPNSTVISLAGISSLVEDIVLTIQDSSCS